MRPSELTLCLTKMIAARQPVLLVGAPGIGKTDLVTQAAFNAGCDLVISHPAVADPTDAKGFPWAEKGATTATFLPFGETARVINAKRPTVWFMDDLGQAPPAVQASYMPWLLARQVNGHRLSDLVTIIAATNRRTDRAGVSGILEPVKSRFTTILNVEPDLDEWVAWAMAQPNFPPEVIAFLRFQPNLLEDFKATADLTNSPSPRTWASAARVLLLDLPKPVRRQALAGAVGEGAATALGAFLDMYEQLPNLDAILTNPKTCPYPVQPGTLYAVTTALATRASKTTFPGIAQFAARLTAEGHGEFAALLLRDSVKRHPEVQETMAFIELAGGELGQLFSGTAQ